MWFGGLTEIDTLLSNLLINGRVSKRKNYCKVSIVLTNEVQPTAGFSLWSQLCSTAGCLFPANLQICAFCLPVMVSLLPLLSPVSSKSNIKPPVKYLRSPFCHSSIFSLNSPLPIWKLRERKPLKTPRSRQSETKSNSCNHLKPHAIRPLQRHKTLWIAA